MVRASNRVSTYVAPRSKSRVQTPMAIHAISSIHLVGPSKTASPRALYWYGNIHVENLSIFGDIHMLIPLYNFFHSDFLYSYSKPSVANKGLNQHGLVNHGAPLSERYVLSVPRKVHILLA